MGTATTFIELDTLLLIVVVAVVASLVMNLFPRLRVPQIVLLIAGGVLIGPHVLGLGAPHDVQLLADVGLGFVFLLAGYEVDIRTFGRDPGRRAIVAWFGAAVVAAVIAGVLELARLTHTLIPVAVALTTTALGTLLPVLRESGMLEGRLGQYVLAAGAVGELLPVLAIALFLGVQNRFVALLSLAAVGVLAGLLALGRRLIRPNSRLVAAVLAGQHATTQTTLRATLLLLIALLAVTDRFHLDAVLGAFLAGLVLRHWAGPSAPALEPKLDAIAYGFFVPVFFVYTGMALDLPAIAAAPARLLVFFALLVLAHALPTLVVYRGVLTLRERIETILVTATSLPLLVALAEIGVRNRTLEAPNAAALVGAGVLSVLLLPALAVTVHERGGSRSG